MAVPTYDKFIEPVLRFLAGKPEGVPARDAHEAAADALNLNDNQRAEVIASGQLVYKNRAGWAHDRLKRAGLSQSLSRGKWCLTPEGIKWVQVHTQPLTEEQVNHLAFDFMNVKLKQQPDAVDLDPRPVAPNQEEFAKSSPDDRLDQALKELRDAVADELLENLLQVSPARFEVIVWMFFIVWDMADIGMTYNVWVVLVMVASTALFRLINWGWKKFTYRLSAGRTQLVALNFRRSMVRWPDRRPNEEYLLLLPALLLRREILPIPLREWYWLMVNV